VSGPDAVCAPPEVCGHADVRLAHEQMRAHRGCRIERCVWKAAAYHTLVSAGCLAPQAMSPRERAASRGIRFPSLEESGCSGAQPTVHTLQEVLARLTKLAAAPETDMGMKTIAAD
jgi:hypothetical protein